MTQINDIEFSLLRGYLLEACGIDVTPEKRYLFATRLGVLLGELGCASFSELYNRLRHRDDPVLRKRLVEAMTTHETGFFRDLHPFDNLERFLLPELARRRAEKSMLPPRLRLLSVGCSTGEEPYSLAICLDRWLRGQSSLTRNDVSVMAVDISRAVLDIARQGVYDEDRLRGLPASTRQDYLRRTPQGKWAVRQDVRALVTFGEANLAESLDHLGSFDVIFCRNVIIYFSLELKKTILRRFYQMLNDGGVLVLGASENLYKLSGDFTTRHLDRTTCYVKEGVSRT